MPILRDLTAEEISVLAGIIAKLRPHGAPRWQAPGIRAAFVKTAHLDAANVLMAAIRLSQDRSAETPGQIATTSAECWREKPSDWKPPAAPFDPHSTCDVCGKDEATCRRNPFAEHGFVPVAIAPKNRIPDEHVKPLTDDLRDRVAKAEPTEPEPRPEAPPNEHAQAARALLATTPAPEEETHA